MDKIQKAAAAYLVLGLLNFAQVKAGKEPIREREKSRWLDVLVRAPLCYLTLPQEHPERQIPVIRRYVLSQLAKPIH